MKISKNNNEIHGILNIHYFSIYISFAENPLMGIFFSKGKSAAASSNILCFGQN
jgi:hypothetical protein